MVNEANKLIFTSPEWGCKLQQNCLPVSMMIIEEVKKFFPDAKVVIGDAIRHKNIALTTLQKNSIKHFSKIDPPSTKPDFHAWIKVDKTRILDIVGPSWFGIEMPYLDEENSKEFDITYQEVLSNPVDVDAFYIRLKKGTKEQEWK
ncbi:hypothetical protein HYO34_22955 [Vibrio parahaemolyticus]|nr:hypothetical protein [Vibrio parahaemolyticus]